MSSENRSATSTEVEVADRSSTEADHTVGGKEEAQQRKDINDWLPITAARKAKWWYSSFHNVTAIVGAGVLGLPFVLSQLGWTAGLLSIILSWIITYYTLWQMVELHEDVPGKRFDRYAELGQYAFGDKLGYWIVMPQQMLVQVASCIVYMVTGGKSLKKFIELAFEESLHDKMAETYYIIIFIGIHLGLSQIPNFNSLKGISLLAAIMSVSYSTVACLASVVKGLEHHPSTYGVRASTTPGKIFQGLSGVGTVAFAYAAHSVALEIQASIPSTPETPSKIPMMRGVNVAYWIVLCCYVCVASAGYWAFGTLVEDDVLISLENPAWLVAIANLMVFFHVIGSYQVFAMPVFDLIESYMVNYRKYTPGKRLRLVARSIFVLATGLVGVCLPFFGALLGFFGGLFFSSTSYVLPCIIWLKVKKPKAWTFHWVASWICIIVGVLVAVLAPIGGLREIILSAKAYKLFS